MVKKMSELEKGDKFYTPRGRYTFFVTSIGSKTLSFTAVEAELSFKIPIETAALFEVTTCN